MFIRWLHEQGYTYHGDAAITGLTQLEIDTLQLGFIIDKEQEEQEVESRKRGRKYTRPRRTTQQAMDEFANRGSA